jgi:fission 1 protein
MFAEDEIEKAILEDYVTAEDLKKYESLYHQQIQRGPVDKQTKWDYALCLVRSRYSADVRKGRSLLYEIAQQYPDEDTRTGSLYFLALACAKLKEYKESLQYIRELLRCMPSHGQATQLEKIVSNKLEREGMMGMAIAGGAVMGIGALIGLGVALARRK